MLCSVCLILFLTNTISSESELIRLTYGNNSCSGRVEVFYNNQWGTVCDDDWGMPDAAVVCREMGCGDALDAKRGAYFGQHDTWQKVLMSKMWCAGSESTLSSCYSQKEGAFTCDHSRDAGVICKSVVRLVNGSHSCSGRVEVFKDNGWGTVCDSGWDSSDAAVLCKEMGCGHVFEPRIGGFFGQGSGSVRLNDVQCSNTESTLKHCHLQGWGEYPCGQDKDAAVACQSRVKLANGFNACSGRVQMFYNRNGYNEWGTVCDNNWDLSDAAVVCREVGCGDPIAAKKAGFFGKSWGLIWLDNVRCTGNEFMLASCLSSKTESYDLYCKDAGVVCQSLVKLVDGANSCSGRVEVFFDGRWGTVCDNGWDQSDAALVCEELGCGNVIDAKSAAYFGPGSGPVWLSEVQCAGSSSLRNCNSNGWGQSTCGHEKDAAVVCQLNMRLVDGIASCSGRVEVFRDSQWGTVFDDEWGPSDAAVVCRQMGCGDAIEAKGGAYFGPGVGEIFMGTVKCFGNETMLSDCESSRWGMTEHSRDAGVFCKPSLRLSNGHNTCSGRVEILYNGTWGTVCDRGWDLTDAAVVCRDMGCGDVIEAKSAAYFGQGSGPVWISNVQCFNTNSRLRECKSNGWGRGSCGHDKDAGVICKDNVRLVNGSSPCEGRVEVLRANQWGTVCDDGWDEFDAEVVCRQLGCGYSMEVKNASYFGIGSGPVWMKNASCFGNEPGLMSCSHVPTPNQCGHEKDAGVICGSIKFMLRVEVKVKQGVDPNSAGILNKLSEEIEKKIQTTETFSLRNQDNGKIFQKKIRVGY